MTRNTRLFKIRAKINGEETEVIFRDLTALELSFLGNLKDESTQEEMAGRISLINIDADVVPWAIRIQIGQKVLEYSNELAANTKLEEVLSHELRQSIEYDYTFYLISIIKRVFPTESIIELMNLTFKDLLELVIFAEKFTGKQLLLSPDAIQKQKKRRKLRLN